MGCCVSQESTQNDEEVAVIINDVETKKTPTRYNCKCLVSKDDGYGGLKKLEWVWGKSTQPVAICAENLIPNPIRNQLLTEIKQLQNNVKDYRIGALIGRGTGKIHDLIDPSLNLNWFQNDLKLKDQVEAEMAADITVEKDTRELERHVFGNYGLELRQNRGSWLTISGDYDNDSCLCDDQAQTYGREIPIACWVPAVFDLNDYKFVSPINNLSFLKYGDNLYKTIAMVFKHMIPMFEEIINYKLKDCNDMFNKDEIQVIVKMQDYLLNENEHYVGNLHKEGISEEQIVALGIYYFDINPNIIGGNLDIIKKYAYSHNEERIMGNSVQHIKTGTCVVLSNVKTYHKVSKMENKTLNSGILSRKILSFFLINPKGGIKSSRDILVNWDDITIYVLNSWFRSQNKSDNEKNNERISKWMPNELVQIIINYVIGLGRNRYTLRDNRMKVHTHIIKHNPHDISDIPYGLSSLAMIVD